MQTIIDFIPLLLALLVYKQYDIYAATIVLMVTLPLIPIGQKLLGKKVSQVHVWSAGLVIVFGAATLIFRDPRFVMMKPTILYFGLAAAFAGAQWFAGMSLAEKMMSGAITLPPAKWRQLGFLWAAFFVLMGLLNIYVATSYSEATWFQFKVWGFTGLTVLFIIGQSVWIALNSEDDVATDESSSAETEQ